MKKSRNFIANLFDVNSAALDSKGRFSCGANPLADLCLVSLWKDVDVGLEGAGFNHSFVSGGHRQNPAEDREQLLTLASGKLQAVLACIKAPPTQRLINKDGSLKVCLYSSTFRFS